MTTQIFDVSRLEDLQETVAVFATAIRQGAVHLHGDLGAGKTTFVRLWLQTLGWREAVTSPTYQLVNYYPVAGRTVFHADLYRLAEPEELLYADVEEWTQQGVLLFVEWPERGEGILPPPDYRATLTFNGKVRRLQWQATDE